MARRTWLEEHGLSNATAWPSDRAAALDVYRVPPYLISVSHTIKHKSKLIGRVRRIKGQLEAVERALESEIGCADVLMLVASVRGAIGGLTSELLEEHIRHHVVDPAQEKDPEKAKGAADLIDVIRTYLK
jgi:DNA-binding FrmR family transcriptional regulator